MQRVVVIIAVATMIVSLAVGAHQVQAQTQTPAPPVPTAEDEQAAVEAADAILALAAEREFNTMYDRIHPDAHAVVPRVVAVKAFEESYEAAQAGRGEVTAIEFIEWTWEVTDKTYPLAADVEFEQPAVDPNTGRETTFDGRMILVKHNGEWRWFFGDTRAFVAEAIAKYAPPAPSNNSGDIEDLLNSVVADLDQYFATSFEAVDQGYQSPGVVAVDESGPAMSACGLAQSGFWAFYCPPDQTIYLDIPFLSDLNDRYGDFAAAFVVGHEWSHHVQTSLGIERSEQPDELMEVYSIQLELMADCLTGTWALDADTRGLLDLSDLAEAMAFTNERLGDPEQIDPFNPQAHGSNTQRVNAFQKGYEDGYEGCGKLIDIEGIETL